MCYNVKKMCRKSSPFGEGKGEGPLPHMGISVITPLSFGGGDGGGATTCFEPCVFCSSVSSVRKRMSLHKQKNVPS